MNPNAVRCVAGPSAPLRGGRALQLILSSSVRRYVVPATYKHPEMEDPQLNGYPKMPYVSRQYLPAKGWQDPQMRRNFGDTLHEEEEILSMWGPDIPVVSPPSALRQFSLAALGFVGLGFICSLLIPDSPMVHRQYPYDGLKEELGGLEENKALTEDEGEGDED